MECIILIACMTIYPCRHVYSTKFGTHHVGKAVGKFVRSVLQVLRRFNMTLFDIKTRLSRFSLFFPGFYLPNKLAKNNRVF